MNGYHEDVDAVGTRRRYLDGEYHSVDDKPSIECPDGIKYWHKNGRTHRDGDQPAIITPTSRSWYQEGRPHRDNDKPAVIEEYKSQTIKAWYTRGVRHREGDKPAIINEYRYGDQWRWTFVWMTNGHEHREEDKPAVMHANGTTEWWIMGKLHREGDRPAKVTAEGIRYWYWDGKLHRPRGFPAIVHPSGAMQWYEHGIEVKPNFAKIEHQLTLDVAIALCPLDLPVLIVLEIVNKLLFIHGLTYHQAWQIAKNVKEKNETIMSKSMMVQDT